MFEQPKEEQGGRNPLLIGLAVGAFVVVAILSVIFYQSYAQKRDREAIKNLEKRAKEQSARQDFKVGNYNNAVYLKGKIAVFNTDENTFDISQEKLPEYLRAMSDDELETLVTVSCKSEMEAYYYYESLRERNSAWGKKCRLQVVDLSTNEIVGWKEIYGHAPPLQKEQRNAASVEAKHPDDQIISYLTTLPRK